MTSRSGKTFLTNLTLPFNSAELLLHEIQTMPRCGRVPIGLDAAFEMFFEHTVWLSQQPGMSVETMRDTHNLWVHWVSARGFYIELDHSEYRPEATQ